MNMSQCTNWGHLVYMYFCESWLVGGATGTAALTSLRIRGAAALALVPDRVSFLNVPVPI